MALGHKKVQEVKSREERRPGGRGVPWSYSL